MRQFFSLRFWATVGGMVLLAFAVVIVASRSNPGEPLAAPEVIPRRVETGEVVVRFRPDPGWGLRSGMTVGSATVVLDDGREFLLGESTPGEVSCDAPTLSRSCVLVADLLGGAIIWFALLPAETGRQVTLPGVVAVLEQGREARLSNGWVVALVGVVRRQCSSVETQNFRDFVARIGADGTATFDLDLDRVTTVSCNAG